MAVYQPNAIRVSPKPTVAMGSCVGGGGRDSIVEASRFAGRQRVDFCAGFLGPPIASLIWRHRPRPPSDHAAGPAPSPSGGGDAGIACPRGRPISRLDAPEPIPTDLSAGWFFFFAVRLRRASLWSLQAAVAPGSQGSACHARRCPALPGAARPAPVSCLCRMVYLGTHVGVR